MDPHRETDSTLMAETYLVTGPTGLLGRWLVRSLLRHRPQARLALLVRAPDEPTAWRRCEELLAGTDLAGATSMGRITPVRGDVTQPGLGIAPQEYDDLVHSLDGIFHCAATIRFDTSPAEADLVNVHGTSQVLDLARKAKAAGRPIRLNYVSTAFVAGRRTGCFREDDSPETEGFFNEYERSKAQAERMVRAAGSEFPISIYRPSQIVGDSRTGEVVNPGLLYGVVRFCFRGNRIILPRAKGVTFDLVPVDYAADALEYLSRQPTAAGGTFHLVAGPRRAIPAREFADLIRATANALRREQELEEVPAPIWVFPFKMRLLLWLSLLTEKGRKYAKVNRPVLEYLTLARVYDDQRARQLLEPAGIRPPPVSDYVATVFGRFLRESSATAKAKAAVS
jgi:thioester reductase-like protein